MTIINGRQILYTAAPVKEWQESVAWQLKGKPTFTGKVRISYFFYCKDNRRRDVDNMIATVNDALVKAGIIEDDDWKHLTIGIGMGILDKENPRGEIKIEEIREASL